jgi:hypothetical protein
VIEEGRGAENVQGQHQEERKKNNKMSIPLGIDAH